VSLFHRRPDNVSPPQDAVPAPPAAPAAAPPPSPDELDAVMELTRLRDQVEDGTLTRAEFDARRKDLGAE
jgi:hypothetical protein